MGLAAAVFPTPGITVVGFGPMPLGDVPNPGHTKHRRERADIVRPVFWMSMAEVVALGAAPRATGGPFAPFSRNGGRGEPRGGRRRHAGGGRRRL